METLESAGPAQPLPTEYVLAPEGAGQLTVRELLGPDESLFFTVGEDDIVRPRDPVTGDSMRPGEVPPSLLAELRKGFDFWEQHGSEVRFKLLLLTQHDTGDGLAASAIDLHAEAERLHDTGGVLFLEGVGGKSSDFAALCREVVSMPEDFKDAAKEEMHERTAANPKTGFSHAVAEQIFATNVAVAFPDTPLAKIILPTRP